MPPKKDNAPKSSKVAVDKSFGMKNKKGGAAQKQIKQLHQAQASSKSPEEKRKAAEKEAREKEKAAAEKAQRENAELFKPVQVQKVPFGVDPKTVLCQFYKAGTCDKGRKCKFSHDLAVERKGEKRNLYADTRDGDGNQGKNGEGRQIGEDGIGEQKKKDDMSDWDEAKLRSVVSSKHGNPKTTTDKVCTYFIEAVENGKYGWFWTCPNGGDTCKYKHSLPPGFVLKTKEQRAAEKAAMEKSPLATLTLEDWLETERHKLQGTLTPVTQESFTKWKKERLDKRVAEEAARRQKEATGRALFDAGGWEGSDEDSDDDEGGDSWNMEAMRNETENLRVKKEEERMAKEYGTTVNGDGGGGGGGGTNGVS